MKTLTIILKRWFDTSNYDENDKRPLPIGKNRKVIGLFKDELDGKIMTEFTALRSKSYTYLMEDGSEHKKAKGIKKCIIKRAYVRFKCDYLNVYTEEVDKIALSSNDDKRLQTFDGITTYPFDAKAFKVCESEMMVKNKAIPIKLYYNKI